MSNFPDAHKVYDLAAVFRERVIEQGRSFLWPDQEIWTPENVDEVLFWMIKTHNEGELTLQTISDLVMTERDYFPVICADMVAIRTVPGPFKGVEEVVRRVNALSTSEMLLSRDVYTWDAWVESLPLGLSTSSFGWKGHWVEGLIGSLNTIRAVIRARGFDGMSQSEIWVSLQNVSVPENSHAQWFAWELLEALYPKELPFALHQDFRKIIDAHAHLGYKYDTAVNFETLRSIREHLAPGIDPRAFSFYSPDIQPLWSTLVHTAGSDSSTSFHGDHAEDLESPGGVSGYSHIVDERAPIYEVVELFRARAIVGGKSLLWPNSEVWTEAVLTRFLADFGRNEAQKGQSWLDVFRTQTNDSDPRTRMLLADSYAFLMQFPSTDDYKGSTKANLLASILQWVEGSPDQETLAKVNRGFDLGIGSPGMAFAAAISHQLAFVPLFVKLLSADSTQDIQSVADDAVSRAKTEFKFKKTTVPARNIVLHLLEPMRYERIASRAHKQQIVDSFSAQLEDIDLDPEGDLDSQLRRVRAYLSTGYFAPNFDFYDEDVVPYWLGNTPWPPPPPPPPIDELAAVTHLDQPFLEEIEVLLLDKKQLIFEGPPGSGKTFVAEKFARFFTGQPLDSNKPDDHVELIQFHQSYGYEDFVEGIRPKMDNGQLVYQVEAGVFLKMVKNAAEHPLEKYVLIIDEINRGNVSRILGELMLLLEYRDKSARLPYSKDLLQIPENLYIIGTMNSADRSLSQIDYALRRRFYFVRFMSVAGGRADVLERWLQPRIADIATRQQVVGIFVELNHLLRDRLKTDDLQVGHSYFMHASIHEERQLEQVWKYAVEPLLREYLYHDRDRDKLLESFSLNAIRAKVSPVDEPIDEPDAFESTGPVDETDET